MSGIPLDPGAGGQSILPDALEIADIIVSTTGARVSGAIRAGSLSRVSHAMLYIGQGRVVEAIDEGVTIRSLQTAISTGRLAVAYRRNGLSGGGAERVAQWAKDKESSPYDLAGAAAHPSDLLVVYAVGILGVLPAAGVAIARSRTSQAEDRFFCSQLIIRAFEEAGYPIIEGRLANMNPQQLVRAWSRGKLAYVGHLQVH